jgi:lipoate-protein ligase A
MIIDENLLEEQREPSAVPVLRFFRWERPTISHGRLQDPRWVEEAARQAEQAEGRAVDVVRRPTGGGTVRHDKDLSFSLAWRRNHATLPKCLKDAYRAIHEAARLALAAKGIKTEFYLPAAKPTDIPGFCFTEPAEDDLMWNRKKILGGALRVTGWGRLYQGNLLTEPLGLSAEEAAKLLAISFEHNFFLTAPLRSVRPSRTC